jgi:hypothetical protein
MLATLFVTLVVGCAIAAGVVLVSGFVVKALFGLILLPLRILGWVLFLPLLIIKGVFGLVALPLLLVLGVLTALAVAVPLLPVAAGIFIVWILVRAASRPAAA